jgi:hypothetical protein
MAKRITKAQRQQAEADEFRTTALSLLHLRHSDWTEWEFEWLRATANRNPSYRFSDKEQAKLIQLRGLSKPFTSYAGETVAALIKIAFPLRFDLDENFLRSCTHGALPNLGSARYGGLLGYVDPLENLT